MSSETHHEMDREDLNAALAFAIRRIDEQAMRSGQPLDEEQRFLLDNLPDRADFPEFSTGDPDSSVDLRLRDTSYERLIALAKVAYRNDREMNPGSQDWEFALNVAKLNRHPICWLLQWAGVKQQRPWWDRWLLVIASLLFIVLTVPLIALIMNRGRAWWLWAVVGGTYIGLVLLMKFVSKRIEDHEVRQNIERSRAASRVMETIKQ